MGPRPESTLWRFSIHEGGEVQRPVSERVGRPPQTAWALRDVLV